MSSEEVSEEGYISEMRVEYEVKMKYENKNQ